MTSIVVPLLATLPWVVPILVTMFRARNPRSLDDVPRGVVLPAPPVSVVVPARNERRNIERCVRSILTTEYPSMELIVVDDHSTDGTGDAARGLAADDARLRVVEAADLPAGWFGKQWACATGAVHARGEIVVFTDADTYHAPDLLSRAVNEMRTQGADLLSVAGTQEMHSFWERVIQPQMFALLLLRYGGTAAVSNAKRAVDVIANGQFIAVRREAYDAVGGHALVRDKVAEDMALAQEFHRANKRLALVIGVSQFSTHMYASLRELVGGWRKNIYAGGRSAVMGGAFGQALYPFMLVAWPVVVLVPPVMLVVAAMGAASMAWLVWSTIIVGVSLAFWAVLYRFMDAPVWYALIYPLGAAMGGYIAVGAVLRGQRVEWKERTYISS